jgi:hypothetical protein
MKKNIPLEDLPLREGGIIRRIGWNSKKSEGLQHHTKLQIHRFLNKYLGHKWDKVYSLLCNPSPDQKMRYNEMRKYIYNYVELNVKIIDGEVYGADGYRLSAAWRRQYYIYNGILKYVQNTKVRRYSRKNRKLNHPYTVVDGKYYCMKNGIHYEIEIEDFTTQTPSYLHMRRCFCYGYRSMREFISIYGRPMIFKCKKQLSKKELKKLGFENAN